VYLNEKKNIYEVLIKLNYGSSKFISWISSVPGHPCNVLFVIMVHKEKKVGKHRCSAWVHVLSFIDVRLDIFLAGNVRILIFLIFCVMYRTVGSELVVVHVLEDSIASILWVEDGSSVCVWNVGTNLQFCVVSQFRGSILLCGYHALSVWGYSGQSLRMPKIRTEWNCAYISACALTQTSRDLDFFILSKCEGVASVTCWVRYHLFYWNKVDCCFACASFCGQGTSIT